MATGVGMGFDLDALDKAIKSADKGIEKLIKNGQRMEQALTQNFRNVAEQGVGALIGKLSEAKQALNNMGGKASVKIDVSRAVDEVVKLTQSIEKVGGKNNLAPFDTAMQQMMDKIVRLKNEIDTFKSFEGGNLLNTKDYEHIGKVSDELNSLMKQYTALDEARKKMAQSESNFSNHIDNVKGVSIEYQRQKAELDKLNNNYRTGNSELQKKAKAEDEAAKAAEKAIALAQKEEKQRLKAAVAAEKQAEADRKRQEKEYANSTQGSLASYNQLYSPQGVRSLNQMKTVLKQLETAQANINRATKEGQRDWRQVGDAIKRVKRDIESTEKEMGKFHSQQRGILDTSGQLARAMAAVFSVSAIKGYVNKLMQIRGEFELQQRSLQILLQNKDEANALWDKTVALAVKSPYTTKQLVTATKQLAAYRVESEKLYETNKMLADVSIGLGVDMNRLILAFGQVKAANFLRGTELRQFSEAGVNMLDELAKRFTALEGRAVSVGEVFERVSKRMVSFADVEAVFKTITSEGGTFYQMQEKQSETLKGMMLNLKDSYELMLNDIGKDSEDRLKGFVSLMRTIVDNWRTLEPYIKTAGLTFIAYFGASQISKLVSWFGKLATAVRAFGTASAAATAINPWVALATVIGAVAAAIYSVVTATDEMTAAMLEVEKNVTDSLSESITLYKKLTDTINDVTKSSEERNKAYDDLRSKFEEILPDEYLELQYIKDKVNGYEAAEKAMFSYYNSKAYAQKKDKVEQKYADEIDKEVENIISQTEKNINDYRLNLDAKTKLKLTSGAAGVINQVVEEVKAGLVQAEELLPEIKERLAKFAGISENSLKLIGYDQAGNQYKAEVVASSTLFDSKLNAIIEKLKKREDAMRRIQGLPFSTYDEQQASERKQKMQEEIKLVESYFAKLASLYDRVAKGELDADTANVDADILWNEILGTKNIEKYIPILENALEKLGVAATKGSYEYTKALNDIKSELYSGEQGFASMAFEVSVETDGAAKDMFKNFGEELEKEGKKALRGDMQKAIVGAFDYAIDKAELSDASKNMLTKLIPDNKQTTSTVRQNIEGFIKQIGELKQQYDTATQSGAPFIPSDDEQRAIDKYLQGNVELLANYDELLPVLKHIYALLGGEEKSGGKDSQLERLKKQIQLVTQLADDYKKLRDEFGKYVADERIWDDGRTAAFGEVGLDYTMFKVGEPQDEIDNLERLLPYAETLKGGFLEVAIAISKASTEIDSFNQKLENKSFAREFERMFGNYELTLEMEKLNIPPDFAKNLFGLVPTSLNDIRDKTLEWYGLGGMKDQTNDYILGSSEYANLSEPQQSQIAKNLTKIEELYRESDKKLAEQHVKYLIKGYNEGIKIRIKELQEYEKLEDMYRRGVYSTDEYKAIKGGIKEEYAQKARKAEWEDFEKSAQYLNLFDNIENTSSSALRSMLERLQSLKESMMEAGLKASDLKEIMSQIEKVEEELEERKPFSTFINDVNTAVGGLKEYLAAKKEEKRAEEELKRLRSKLPKDEEVAQEERDAKKDARYEELAAEKAKLKNMQEGTHAYEMQRKKVDDLHRALYPVFTQHQEITEQIKEEEDNLNKAQETTRNWKEALKGIGGDISDFGAGLEQVAGFLGDMAKKWKDAFGLEDAQVDNIQATIDTISGAGEIGVGIGKLTAGDAAGIKDLVSGVLTIGAAFGKLNDKKKERQIQEEIKLVERLQRVYEDLGETIQNAYNIDTLNEATEMSKENLLAQIDATNRMIEAEKGKKNTDWDRIEEWEQEIEEYKDMIRELEETRLQELGAFASDENKKSGAQAFVDAWLEAYKETGDGLSGLNEQFDEFFEEMVKKQLVQRATNKYLSKFYEEFDRNIQEYADSEISGDEAIKNIKELENKYMPELNAFLENFIRQLSINEDLAGSTAELGGLQAGISGITEDQADILAAYWSTVRLYTVDTNTKVTDLVNKLFSEDATANPMLSQLKALVAQTTAIHDLFDSVVGRGDGGKHSGAYLKVAVG